MPHPQATPQTPTSCPTAPKVGKRKGIQGRHGGDPGWAWGCSQNASSPKPPSALRTAPGVGRRGFKTIPEAHRSPGDKRFLVNRCLTVLLGGARTLGLLQAEAQDVAAVVLPGRDDVAGQRHGHGGAGFGVVAVQQRRAELAPDLLQLQEVLRAGRAQSHAVFPGDTHPPREPGPAAPRTPRTPPGPPPSALPHAPRGLPRAPSLPAAPSLLPRTTPLRMPVLAAPPPPAVMARARRGCRRTV